MGGETPNGRPVQLRRSIPAWAGKPRIHVTTPSEPRSIPAWAGKPPAPPCCQVEGPSPRGRGNRTARCQSAAAVVLARVHPRVGGETRPQRLRCQWSGVHPRVGGETPSRSFETGPSWAIEQSSGSIPAWAGKPSTALRTARLIRGSIPAWAGETVFFKVHPRVGGETPGRARRKREGPSPRGRGNQHQSHAPPLRVHPRVGGETARLPCAVAWRVHPRVGGETLHQRDELAAVVRVHPRVGGETRAVPVPNVLRDSGSIPAWAGKPDSCRRRSIVVEVHPRVGGETPWPVALLTPKSRVHPRVGGETRTLGPGRAYLDGPSPRGRGNPESTAHSNRQRVHPRVGGETFVRAGHGATRVHPRVGGETPGRPFLIATDPAGSIPAWAGKPRAE